MLRIVLVVSGMQVGVAGQLKAMNSFQEKMSTAGWFSPCAGQASTGAIACAAVMAAGQVEPAQPVPPWHAAMGGAALAPSAMKSIAARPSASAIQPLAMRALIM